MTTTYLFRYRRLGQIFWRKHRVVGHGLSRDPSGLIVDPEKMVLYFADGSIQEICAWTRCEVRLGSDFFSYKKAEMETAAGQAIPTSLSDSKRQ